MIIFGSLDGVMSKRITRIEEGVLLRPIMVKATLHLLQTCPFSWKVRGIIEHLGMDVDEIQVNAMKTKKELSFTNGWNKVPVFTDAEGTVVVDSTPIMSYIDDKYNQGKLSTGKGTERYDNMLDHVDNAWKSATIPILYGSLGSALSTTRRVSKLEKFGFISRRLYAWAGFPIMWGIIARKRVKKDGRTPKKLWHDLLTEYTESLEGNDFFGGNHPDLVDFAAFGYMRSVSPFKQFRLLEEHENGMVWYRKMEQHLN
jgi:glutathione S-transferase